MGILQEHRGNSFLKRLSTACNILRFLPLQWFCLLLFCWLKLSRRFLYCTYILRLMIVYRIIPKVGKSTIPKRIYITDNKMVCIADDFTEKRSVELVKKVYDYGDFLLYIILFRKNQRKLHLSKEFAHTRNYRGL